MSSGLDSDVCPLIPILQTAGANSVNLSLVVLMLASNACAFANIRAPDDSTRDKIALWFLIGIIPLMLLSYSIGESAHELEADDFENIKTVYCIDQLTHPPPNPPPLPSR